MTGAAASAEQIRSALTGRAAHTRPGWVADATPSPVSAPPACPALSPADEPQACAVCWGEGGAMTLDSDGVGQFSPCPACAGVGFTGP